MLAEMLSLALASAQPDFRLRPCPKGTPERAVCGLVRVPEDRARPEGRAIDLSVILLKSPVPARLPPLFDVDGGPGLPSSKNAGFYAANGVSKDRDIVLVDQRGTGRSNGLMCPGLSAVPPSEPMLPPALVADCLDSLRRKADLRHYGTADAILDLEAVRTALGHGKIDLFGLSYGTTVALAYMRRFPANVRAAVLMGTAPPKAMAPQHHATAAQRALDLTLADCAAIPACKGRFPDLRAKLDQARERASAPELLMERFRVMLYAPARRAGLPLAVERAAAGDASGLFGTSNQVVPAGLLADGMFLTITCGESFPLMDFDKAAAAARATPFGDYRLRRQREACANWPKARLDPDHLELPTETGASVLLISGHLDPVTPPEWADTIASAMKNARHVVIPAGGHIPDGLANFETCLDGFTIAFFDHGDLKSLDTSCVASMTPPDYEIGPDPA